MRRRALIAGTASAALSARLARADESGTVVLELFTSQGCSSCPPADALLGEMCRLPGTVALSWHVDYWNYLGWRDPYARREWTERQRAYARALGDDVYTPALVVNGKAVVVGSDRPAVASTLRRAGGVPAGLTLAREAGGLAAVVGPLPGPATLLLALYDLEHTTAIGNGENGGRRLREFNVVREVRTMPASPGRVLFPGIGPGQGAAVLLQDAGWRILGAASAEEKAA